MTFNEVPLPKCPVTEQSGGMLLFDSKAKSTGKYVNPLYHYLHEVVEGRRGDIFCPDTGEGVFNGLVPEVHRHDAPDGTIFLVLLPQAMTGVCTSTNWRFTFQAAVLHVGKKTGQVNGWLVSTHENGWFNFNAHKEIDDGTDDTTEE